MSKLEIRYLRTKDSISLQYNNVTKIIDAKDERYAKVVHALKEGRTDDIPEIVDATAQFRKAGIEVEEGLLKIKGQPMPPELNERILEYKREGIPFKSLLNFWAKLQQNPSFNSRQQLFKFLENKGHAICEDGDFIGYRGVREDYKDQHTGKFDNRPGNVHEMARTDVDDNPNNTCSHGFHVGAYTYSKGFAPKLMIVKVNPRDVVAVPNDYNGQKMRVCRFEVLSETQAALTTPVVSNKGTKIEKFEEDDDAPIATGQPLKGAALELFESTEPSMLELTAKARKAAERKHKARYANNHAKRGPDGKFAAKKKNRK